METMLRSKVTVLFMMLGLLIAVPAVALAQDAGDPTGAPSPAPPAPVFQSDKEDYPPADTVILTGSGWQPITRPPLVRAAAASPIRATCSFSTAC